MPSCPCDGPENIEFDVPELGQSPSILVRGQCTVPLLAREADVRGKYKIGWSLVVLTDIVTISDQ